MLALVVAVIVVVLRDDTQRAELRRPVEQATDRAGATAELLFQLEQALTSGDAAALAELADPDVPTAQRELRQLARNVRALRIDRLSLRYLARGGAELTGDQRTRYGAEAWVSELQLTWRFRGYDEAASTLEVPVVTDWAGDRAVFVTSRVAAEDRVPLWWSERLVVRRTSDTLVLAGDRGLARALHRQARTAVATVRRTLPRWRDPLVIEAPESVADFRTAAGLSAASSRAIAAVTTTTDGSTLTSAPVHVYLNPDVFTPLGPVGRQIVVSHEATHVALDAATAELPLWLSEGMADYVALVDTPLPDTVLAAQIRDLVRTEGPPARLPGEREFDGSNKDIGAYYEAAWLAVRLLADTYGPRTLLAFYRQAQADGDTDAAFRRVLGTTESEFRRRWQDSLVELAR